MGDKQKQNNNGTKFVVGAVIGSIVGASCALLLTPKSGKDLRVDLNDGVSQLKTRANDLKDVAYVKGYALTNKAIDKGSSITNGAVDSATQFTKNVSKKTKRFSQSVQSKFQDKDAIESKARKQAEDVAGELDKAELELTQK